MRETCSHGPRWGCANGLTGRYDVLPGAVLTTDPVVRRGSMWPNRSREPP